MPARDLIIQSAIQVAEIGGVLCAFYLAFGLSLVGILAYRLGKEEEKQR